MCKGGNEVVSGLMIFFHSPLNGIFYILRATNLLDPLLTAWIRVNAGPQRYDVIFYFDTVILLTEKKQIIFVKFGVVGEREEKDLSSLDIHLCEVD